MKKIFLVTVFVLILLFMNIVNAQPEEKIFGNNEIGDNFGGFGNRKYACKYNLPESGNVTKISFHLIHNVDATEAKVAIYNDNNGPNNLIVQSTSENIAGTIGWIDIDVLTTTLTPGDYWIAVTLNSDDWGNHRSYDPGDANQSAYFVGRTYTDEMTDPFGTITDNYDNALSIYATYTTGETLPAPTYPVNITGIITDSDTGSPIQGATVTCNAFSDTTNSTGGYFIMMTSNPGSCDLTASRTGYITESTTINFPTDRIYNQDFSLESISVTHSITGRLTDRDNNPVDATIEVYQQETIIDSDQTDTEGNYDLTISPGTYDLQYGILNFFIPSFFIKLLSLDISSSLSDIINYVTNIGNQNISFTADINDIQLIQTYSLERPARVLMNGSLIPNVSSYSQLTDNTWFYNFDEKRLYILANVSIPVLTCSDGTSYGECSSTQPLYCDNGDLINYCSFCECPPGYECQTDESCSRNITIDDYYTTWRDDYRVDSRFSNYLFGSTFDFDGFFDQIYDRFLKELETTVYGAGYTRPTNFDYGTANYNPGEPVGNLRNVATKIISTVPELENAFSSAESGDIIFIESGTYVVSTLGLVGKSNIIIAGNGWDTVLYLADGVNFPVIYGTGGCRNIIIRDLRIEGNKANNMDNAMTTGIDFRNGQERTFTENVYIHDIRRMGWSGGHDGRESYIFNSVVIDSGWNCITPARDSYDGIIGNYVEGWRDVGITTWGTDHLVIANNIAVHPIQDGLGFGGGNIGIMVENQNPGGSGTPCTTTSDCPQGERPETCFENKCWGRTPKDSHDVIIRKNIASEANVAPYELRWRGIGIWSASFDHIPECGSYNIIMDGNICENNNRAGFIVSTSTRYPGEEWGRTVVVVNNYAAGNNIFDIVGSPHFGNYVIQRPGVIFENNIEG